MRRSHRRTKDANDDVDVRESRQSLVQTTRKVIVSRHLKQRSINTIRMDRSKEPKNPDVLYLLSPASLLVPNYPTEEAHFTPPLGRHGPR